MILLMCLLACRSPAPTPPAGPPPEPASVAPGDDAPVWPPPTLELPAALLPELERLRREVGTMARGDADACRAITTATDLAPRVEAHLLARHEALSPPDPGAWDDGIADLTAAIPGLVVTRATDVTVDWRELARASGEGPTATALVSVGGLAGSRPAWRGAPGGPPCADHQALGPWLDRLGPSVDRAPTCVAEAVRPALEGALAELVQERCLCAPEAEARAQVAATAAALRQLRVVDGPAFAARLEAGLEAARFGGQCPDEGP